MIPVYGQTHTHICSMWIKPCGMTKKWFSTRESACNVCMYESFKSSQRRQAHISTQNQKNQWEFEGNVISYDNIRILMIHK